MGLFSSNKKTTNANTTVNYSTAIGEMGITGDDAVLLAIGLSDRANRAAVAQVNAVTSAYRDSFGKGSGIASGILFPLIAAVGAALLLKRLKAS